MAVSAKFLADFTQFEKAVEQAEKTIEGFGLKATNVSKTLNRFGEEFSGNKIVSQAVSMAEAIDRIGGASKLTEAELQRAGAIAQQAVEKLQALGKDVPKNLEALAAAAKKPASAFDDLKTAAIGAASAIGLTLSAGAILGAIKSAIAFGGQIEDLAAKLGTSRESAQRFAFAAEQSGSSVESLGTAMTQLSKRIVEGGSGVEPALQRLGLTLDDLKGKSPEQAFLQVGKAINELSNPTEKIAVSMKVFGKAGADLIPVLGNLTEDMKRAVVATDSQIKAADALGDAWSALVQTGKAVILAVITPLIGDITKGTNSVLRFAQSVIDLSEAWTRAGTSMTGFMRLIPGARFFETFNQLLNVGTERALAGVAEPPAFAQLKSLQDAANAGEVAIEGLILPIETASRTERTLTQETDALTAAWKKASEPLPILINQATSFSTGVGKLALGIEKTTLVAGKWHDQFASTLPRAIDTTTSAVTDLDLVLQSSAIALDAVTQSGARLLSGQRDNLEIYRTLPKAIQSQNVSQEKAITLTRDWDKGLDDLARSFELLANVAGDSLDGIVREIGTVVAAMAAGTKAAEGLQGSFAHLDKDGNKVATDFAGIATNAIGMASAFLQATATGSTLSKTLKGALVGEQIGAAFGPIGAAIGAAVGGVGGLLRGLFGGPSEQEKKGRETAANFAAGLTSGLSAAQLAEAGNRQWAQVTIAVRDAYLQVGKTAADAERDVARLWAAERQGPEAVAAVTKEIQAQFTALEKQQALLDKYNVTWQELSGAAQSRALSQAVTALTDDLAGLERAGLSHEAAVKKVGQAYVDLATQAVKAGQGIPAALAPTLRDLAKMGQLTEAQVHALLGLTDANTVDFQRMEDVATKYGISLDSLGTKFQAAKIGAAAQTLIDDFNLLVENGADVNAVIAGMGDEIQDVVKQALRFGTEIPASMRPVLEQMLKQGTLTDENGTALEDLSRINFAKPIEESINDLIAKLDELIDHIGGVGSAITNLPTLPDLQIPHPIPTAVAGPPYVVPSFAQGTKGRLLDFGSGMPVMLHGKERVSTAAEASSEAAIVQAIDALGARLDHQQARLPYVIRDAILLANA